MERTAGAKERAGKRVLAAGGVVGGEGGGSAGEVPGGEEEGGEDGGGPEEKLHGEGGGEGQLGVGIGAGGEAEDQAAEEAEGGREGEAGEGEVRRSCQGRAGWKKSAEGRPVEGEEAGEKGGGFGEFQHAAAPRGIAVRFILGFVGRYSGFHFWLFGGWLLLGLAKAQKITEKA